MAKINYEIIKPISTGLPFVFHHVVRDPCDYNGSFKNYNWHSNLELIFCSYGMVKAFCDERDYTLEKDDIMVVNPESFHGTFAYHNCEYYVLMIDPDFSHSNGIFPEKKLLKEFIRDPHTARLFREIIAAFSGDTELRVPMIRLSVLNLLVHLYSNHIEESNLNTKSHLAGANRIKCAIAYINKHYHKKLTVEDVAKFVGISKSYLSHEFSKYTGRSVIEYINILKCLQAQKLIRGDMNVSEAAASSGFDNLSYFTRTYKKHLGRLPSDDLNN